MISEGGIATITRDDEDSRWAPVPFASKAAMDGWSDFSRAIGAFYLKVGVPGGVDGTLFDLYAHQVEQLVLAERSNKRSHGVNDPLIGLAVCGVWVMQTLAHHTFNSGQWVRLLNGLSGMLNYATLAHISELDGDAAASASDEMTAILLTLTKVYETLNSCVDGGHIKGQLEHHYPKSTRKALNSEFQAHLDELLARVIEQVMALAAQSAGVRRVAVSPIERVQLSKLDEGLVHGQTVVHGTDAEEMSTPRAVETEAPMGPPKIMSSIACKMASFTARASVSDSATLRFMRMSGSQLPASKANQQGAPRVSVSLMMNGTKMTQYSGSTAPSGSSTDPVNPVWANEHIAFEAFVGLPHPVQAEVCVIYGGTDQEVEVVGVATLELTHARGHVRLPLLDGVGGAPTEGTVSLYYEVGPWLTKALPTPYEPGAHY